MGRTLFSFSFLGVKRRTDQKLRLTATADFIITQLQAPNSKLQLLLLLFYLIFCLVVVSVFSCYVCEMTIIPLTEVEKWHIMSLEVSFRRFGLIGGIWLDDSSVGGKPVKWYHRNEKGNASLERAFFPPSFLVWYKGNSMHWICLWDAFL